MQDQRFLFHALTSLWPDCRSKCFRVDTLDEADDWLVCLIHKATDNGPQGWKVAHTSQTEKMRKLADFRGLNYLATSKGRLAWSKRLQRAHKFCLLVDIFGVGILEATPAVSVSKLDKVSLASLKKVENGGVGSEIALSIKSMMRV